MSDIIKAHKLIEAIREVNPFIGDFDKIRDDLVGAEGRCERIIMSTAAKTAEELKIKLSIWRLRIEDPACLFERDVPLWDDLTADIERLAGMGGAA